MYQRFVKLSEINETAKHEATKINWELTSNTKKNTEQKFSCIFNMRFFCLLDAHQVAVYFGLQIFPSLSMCI